MELTVEGKAVRATTGGRRPDPDLPLLVLVHGAGGNRTTWQLQTRYFASHGFAVFAIDLPGHGGSEGPSFDSIEGYGTWLAALVGALEGPAHVVGHSMGALAGLELAARHPGLVSSLSLLGVREHITVHPELLAAARGDDDRAFDFIATWSIARPMHLGAHPAPGIWLMSSQRRLVEEGDIGVLAGDLAAVDDYDAAVQRAAEVKCPVLVMAGELDRMASPRGLDPLVAAFGDATVVRLPEAGHAMMFEQPHVVIDTLRDFLASAETGSAA